MKKITATSLILLMISLFLQQTLSKEILGDAAERNVKQEKEQAHEVHCSRERSRAAWNIIEEYLMPFVERENYQISTKCRLHPDNDLFRNQEQHKIQVDTNDWKCGYCKKSFHAEKYLDQHFDSRHYNLLNVSEGKCLADLCGALHCDFVMNSKSPKTKCKPAAVAKNRHLCEILVFLLIKAVQQAACMNCFCANSAMLTLVQGKRSIFLKGARRKQVSSIWPCQY
ncbi:uncharacterized protein LOC110617680 isoform X4 [Manihot esculenta]|uniref:uncharacterized protein LOC110617680 isoform X4 n=1 Tax=Manihot esculenta TaxID=3983 RepID=UPI001CC4A3B1|nr:uncharacterized protein LOC110617680 isoform X4 [Manihot esculenta]